MDDGIIRRADGTSYLTPIRAEAFLGLVRAGDTVLRALNHTLQTEFGRSIHEFEILLFLTVFAEDRSTPMTDLRQQAPLSQSRVSRIVAGLERDGLVTRSTDPDDTRAVNVTVTKRGVETFKTIQDRHLQDLNDRLFSRLDERDIEQLAEITTKILGRSHIKELKKNDSSFQN